MIIVEDFAGTHGNVGIKKGKCYRHLINNFIQEGVVEHNPSPRQAEKPRFVRTHVKVMERHCPELLEEIEGVAKGAGLPFDEVILLNIYWQGYRKKLYGKEGCFTIGVLDKAGRPIIGTVWDSARVIVVWDRIAVKGRYRFISQAIVGTAFAERGMNEKGLVIYNSSLGKLIDPGKPLLQHSLALRMAMEQCAEAGEAMDLLLGLPIAGSFLMADAKGRMAGLQMTQFGHSVHQPRNGALALGNNAVDPKLSAQLMKAGMNDRSDHNLKRMKRAAELLAGYKRPYDAAFIRTFLADHKHHPCSICNDGNACSVIAEPAGARGTIWIAERFPCRNPFKPYSVLG